jgi:hypothetical protein
MYFDWFAPLLLVWLHQASLQGFTEISLPIQTAIISGVAHKVGLISDFTRSSRKLVVTLT